VFQSSLGLARSGEGRKRWIMKVVGDYAWERCVNKGWIPPTEDIDVFQTKRYTPLVEYFKASRGREVKAMDRVIGPSNYLRQMVIGWGAEPSRVQVIYNALEVSHVRPEISKAEARQQVGWPVDVPYLVTAARL